MILKAATVSRELALPLDFLSGPSLPMPLPRNMHRHALATLFALLPARAECMQEQDQRLAAIDSVVTREMRRREIPGLSLAVVDRGRIVAARAYGVTRRQGGEPVTPDTRFLAGSVSKAIAAATALQLAERGVLALDHDVNAQLRSWRLPADSDGGTEAVTPRHLLAHMSGRTVHGFRGYARGEAIPSLVQVLDGVAPANSPPVRRFQAPGAGWRYSGGGYVLLELLIADCTGRAFADVARDEVLRPAGMSASGFEPADPSVAGGRVAWGHFADGTPVPGGAHAYPERAAAGLWTTASDLARFAIGVQRAAKRDAAAPFAPRTAERMLAYERNDIGGLGLFLVGNGGRLEFFHGGRDEGFDGMLEASATSGQAVAVLINANDNGGAVDRIVREVKRR